MDGRALRGSRPSFFVRRTGSGCKLRSNLEAKGSQAQGAAEVPRGISLTARGGVNATAYGQRIQPPARTRVAGLETDPPEKTVAPEEVSEE
jgi:hypothetical protein